jgi:deoxyribonuclease V
MLTKTKLIEKFSAISLDRDIKGAIEFQKQLLPGIRKKAGRKSFRTICGFDVSYDRVSNRCFAAAVVAGFPSGNKIEERVDFRDSTFPYMPGLLAFREGPTVIDAFRKLKTDPDLLVFDGHGIAHPRGIGIATMMGILLNKASIGCAKSRLVGEWKKPGGRKGDISPLVYRGEVVGNVLRSRSGVKPIFVSVGHLIDLETATDVILRCCSRYRLPDCARAAHILSNAARKQETD